MSKAWERLAGTPQQRLDSLLIHKLGAVNYGLEHETFGVHQQMSLPTAYLLSAVVTTLFPAYSSRFDRLAVYYPGAGLRIPLQANPQPLSDRPVDPLPSAVYSPNSEVEKDRLPWWEVVGKQAPGTATPQDVEDGVQDLVRTMDPRSSGSFRGGKMRLQAGPFGIGEV